MSYIYILAPLALGVIFAACTGGYFLYINYQKKKLLKRLRNEIISERCGRMYTAKTPSLRISQEPEQFTGIYRVRSPKMPYSLEDDMLFSGQQSSIQAESVDTGFYSPYSRSNLERTDYRKAQHSATGGSTLEFPARGTESVNRSGNDRLRRGQIRNSSLQSWKQPALQSGAVTYADDFTTSVMERSSNSRERKSVLDSYASELPPPIPPPRDISRGNENQYLYHPVYPSDFTDDAYSTADRWTHDAERNRNY